MNFPNLSLIFALNFGDNLLDTFQVFNSKRFKSPVKYLHSITVFAPAIIVNVKKQPPPPRRLYLVSASEWPVCMANLVVAQLLFLESEDPEKVVSQN